MSMFLDITSIEGESRSQVAAWDKKIDQQTMSYDVSQRTSLEVGSGLIAGGAVFAPMSIRKTMDKSTPLLWAKLCAGEPIDMVIIRISRPGATKQAITGGLFEAENYAMKNVIVTSYHTSGLPGLGGLPTEDWLFSFTSIVEQYRTVDAQGNLQPVQPAGWDIGANMPAVGGPSMAQS